MAARLAPDLTPVSEPIPEDLKDQIPESVAIIMDGNRRWAKQQGLLPMIGHDNGAESVREVTRTCARAGVKWLTLYALSLENRQRPARELRFLMRLLRRYLIDERDEIMENNMIFTAVGRLDLLPKAVLREYEKTRDMSAGNTGMHLCLALNYGGRAEIVDAAKKIVQKAIAGEVSPDDIDESLFQEHLYDPQLQDPDLLIRTGGEMRISNFLLWQTSYTELWVTPVFWPEFRSPHLYEAFRSFASRDRRLGR